MNFNKAIFIGIILSFIINQNLQAQKNNADELLKMIKENYERIKDYEANAEIKVNLDFIKVPEMNAKVFYKSPDKFKLDSKDFAMLPKQAINFTPANIGGENFTAVFIKNENMNGKDLNVIKVIPNEDSEILASTLWIDSNAKTLNKIESITQKGSLKVNLNYDSKINYPLPVLVSIEMDFPEFRVNSERQKNQAKGNSADKDSGKITIKYSDYKINKGIDDKIFEKKK